jgi:hypothetical protein
MPNSLIWRESLSEKLSDYFLPPPDMCAKKISLVSMGERVDRQACADGELGPPSARAELVRAALCRRCLTAVGHYFAYFSFSSFLVLAAVAKTPEGVVVGFQIFAWAPK